jgi:hypothetical protein
MTRPATPIPDPPEDAEEDRPTVAPPFDVHAFARDSGEADLESEDAEEDRPTVLPPFDADAFARDSELRLKAVVPPRGETTTDEARRLLEDGKPEDALFLLAPLLEQAPLGSEARALANECGEALERECWLVIGSRSAILRVAVSPEELKGFTLDHVSGFLLSLMDQVTDVELLLDISGLPRLLALRHLRGLVTRGVVVERNGAPPR